MKKNKCIRLKNKAFTLIEMLVILTILAMIATITIPLVLNIMDESKKAAAKISATGYKNAINEYYYISKASRTITSTDLNGNYNIINGDLFNTENDETHIIPMTGEAPTSGNINLNKGDIASGCIQIKEYAIVFNNGNISKVEKKDCLQIVTN